MDVNLILLRKDGSQKSLPLQSDVTVIGRRHNCDLRIRLMSVSRKHCQLNRDEGVLQIRDLGSRNGTYLNGKRIDEAVVQGGDSIKIGPLAFVLQIDGQPESPDEPAPDSAVQKQPQEDVQIEDSAAEDIEIFEDSDELDLPEEANST